MISSTASKESAPKSSMKEALSSKSPSGFNWDLTRLRTCSSTELREVTERVAMLETGAKAVAEPTMAARTRDLACTGGGVVEKVKKMLELVYDSNRIGEQY